MLYLKQNTAATIVLGPFLDESDLTPETGLTISQADVRLSKNGGAFAQKNDSNACSHMENGYYSCQLDATDTNTLGRLVVAVSESGALPVWKEFMVVPANVYDSLVGGSDKLQTDAVEISGSSTAADTLEANITNLDEASSALLAAIYNIGVAAASAAEVADGCTVSTGTESGDYEDTHALDETYHTITADGGEIDLYYEFTLGDDAVPVDVHVKGRLHEGSSPSGGDSVDIYVYDWTTSSWEQIVPPLGGFVGVANSDSDDDEVRVIPLFPRHKDSSTNKVRVRFAGTSLETNTALYVDQIYLTHTAVLSYSGIASSILANPSNKLETDGDGHAAADVRKVNGDADSAARLALSAKQMIPGTVEATHFTPTTTEFECADITEATDDHFNNRLILWTSGSLAGQVAHITDYTYTANNRAHFTVTQMTEAPSAGDAFVIV